jgi:regulatory protein
MEFSQEWNTKRSVKLTQEQALVKARAWCASQERCIQETRNKLSDWGLYGEKAEEIIAQLIIEGFLNEERFAKAFAGGKFRIKKWGRRKIIQELKKKHISEPCIRRGISAIDEEDYLATLRTLLNKKTREIRETDPLKRKAGIVNFLIGKGYEPELIRELWND